ncbi:MAG: ATP-binding cassette domain-containing protein, partial [bacterium]
MFRIVGLSHYYNEGQENQVAALADINLEIKRGEFVTIIGTNGSGKSTLAKHLNALLLPSKGRVLVKDMDTRDAAKLWEIRQTVG